MKVILTQDFIESEIISMISQFDSYLNRLNAICIVARNCKVSGTALSTLIYKYTTSKEWSLENAIDKP